MVQTNDNEFPIFRHCCLQCVHRNEMTLHIYTPFNVVYDGVYYNYGNAYNRHSGFFTAPSDGLYVFTWTTYVANDKIFNTQIQLNGEQKGVANCDNSSNPGRENCLNTVPLVLKTGDSVNIRTTTADFIYPVWSSFKGWRVKKTS